MSRRSRRSYAIEFALAAAAIAAIYLWLTSGGPTAFGNWVADWMGTP